MSVGLVTGLLFAAISINMSVECSFKKAEIGTSKSEKIISAQGRDIWNLLDLAMNISKGIHPGTKWCGVGNVAGNYSDFVASEETYKCWKEHDDCKLFIPVGDIKYGVKNTENYTVTDCDCDHTLDGCINMVIHSDSATVHDKQTATEFRNRCLNSSRKCLQRGDRLICLERDSSGNCIKFGNNQRDWRLIFVKWLKADTNNYGLLQRIQALRLYEENDRYIPCTRVYTAASLKQKCYKCNPELNYQLSHKRNQLGQLYDV